MSEDIKGLDQFLAALDRFPDLAAQFYEEASKSGFADLIPLLAKYPSEPFGSTYTRTGDLGQGWTDASPVFAAQSSGFEGTLTNRVSYGPYVQSAQDQAHMHQGYWDTDQEITDTSEGQITAYFETALQQIADQLGSGS